jgi:lipoprotein-anchoring transpeptidase ErfK/SrfK
MTFDLTRRAFVSVSAALLASPAIAHTTRNQNTFVVPPEHEPVIVRLRDTFEPGILLVDPNTFSLYWLLEPRRALRFIVGVGRGDLYESGTFTVGAKKEWPSWTPTKEMIARNPDSYAKYADGMPGGPSNPLGARALYLFDEQRGDTFLRIHGTPEPWTIGSAVSNGCVRLVNDHIQQLYDLVPIGAKVVLYPKRAQS